MNTAELNSVRDLQKKIHTTERLLQTLKVSVDNIVPILDGLPKATGAKSRVEKNALKIIEVERELEDLRSLFVQAKSILADKIMCEVETPEIQTLLMLRYVECCSFNDVARRMRYVLRYVFTLHKRALKKITTAHIATQSEV